MAEVGLELHPDKTRVVYCKDGNRTGSFPVTEFTFLGYTFRARAAKAGPGSGNGYFTGFLPAVSKQALNRMSASARGWNLQRHTDSSEADLARTINPVVRGWMAYYGRFYRSALYPLFKRINSKLARWITRKYKVNITRALRRLADGYAVRPRYFAHWLWTPPDGTVPRTTRAV